jgi:hypothetical protein
MIKMKVKMKMMKMMMRGGVVTVSRSGILSFLYSSYDDGLACE